MDKLLRTQQDKEQFIAWITLLKSGLFRKGKNQLQESENKYCCLGIGCIVSIPENKLNIDGFRLSGGYPGSQSAAPRWLINVNEHFYSRTGTYLSMMNDDESISHRTIAKKLLDVYKDEL